MSETKTYTVEDLCLKFRFATHCTNGMEGCRICRTVKIDMLPITVHEAEIQKCEKIMQQWKKYHIAQVKKLEAEIEILKREDKKLATVEECKVSKSSS